MLEQEQLINEMQHLRRFALRLCKGTAQADDLLQSTLLRAIEKRELFQAGTSVFKWTSKIMFNLFVSEYRRRTKFETQYDPENFMNKESVEANQDVIVALGEVKIAMQSLTEDHRDVLIMVCVQGMQYQEVADIMDIPLGTVRSRLSRAREQLNSLLNDKTSNVMLAAMPSTHSGSSTQIH